MAKLSFYSQELFPSLEKLSYGSNFFCLKVSAVFMSWRACEELEYFPLWKGIVGIERLVFK